jgi:hypothetical protein
MAVAVAAVLGAACSASASPQPAGPTPSDISVEVCSIKAQSQIDQALGESGVSVSEPTWTDHTYACRYKYPDGGINLSVKELSSWTETYSYFDSLAARLGRSQPLFGLGQAAFLAGNGDVVVRKDWKVLLIDSAAAGGSLGGGRSFSGTPAETVASVIMACWAGD